MGNDPKTSVVNRDCQLHDVDNVYVIDGSVHVTNGGFNPALTILANAYRASPNLLQAWKGSRCGREEDLLMARPAGGRGAGSDGARREPLLRSRAAATRCASCHEMQPLYDQWHASSHRGVACEKCHGDALTTDACVSPEQRARALYSHLRGDLPEQIGFANKYVQAMTEQCQGCHRQEYAAWQAGPHSATYARIFLDKKHNTDEHADGRLPALPRHALRRRHRRPGQRRSTAAGPGA